MTEIPSREQTLGCGPQDHGGQRTCTSSPQTQRLPQNNDASWDTISVPMWWPSQNLQTFTQSSQKGNGRRHGKMPGKLKVFVVLPQVKFTLKMLHLVLKCGDV